MGHVSKKSTASSTTYALTQEDTRHFAKPKVGLEHYLEPLIDMYIESEGSMPGFDALEVRAELQAWVAGFVPLAAKRADLSAAVRTHALHGSNAYRGGLQLYQWALTVGRSNPAIKQQVARFEQYMKRRSRKAAPTGSASATPAAASPSGTGTTQS